MSTHYPPESGKTRTEVHAFVDFLLSIRLPPALEERRQCSGRRPSYQLLVVGGCQAHPPQLFSTVHEGIRTAMARCSKKARRSKTPTRSAFSPAIADR